MARYKVITSNQTIPVVYEGDNHGAAIQTYDYYVEMARDKNQRVSGESIGMIEDNQLSRARVGANFSNMFL
jgi:hypothetical protein